MWTQLSYRHVHVNVQSDQQGRRHQEVLYYEDHREYPHALLPMERAASPSINLPLVHQCREYLAGAKSSFEHVCPRREERSDWKNTASDLLFILIARVWVVG